MATQQRRKPTPEELQAGKALAEAIARARLTQPALAHELNVTPGLISQWVTASVRVPVVRAEQVAAVLGVHPGDICVAYRAFKNAPARQVKEHQGAYATQTSMHPAVKRFAALVSSGTLTKQQVDLLIENAEAFAKAIAAANRSAKRTKATTVTPSAVLKKA